MALPLPPASQTHRKTLSVVILSKNAADTLEPCLASVRWADEIILLDGGSTDSTLNLAQQARVKIIEEKTSDDFGKLRNIATAACQGDWILQLDADEVVTLEFRKTLEAILTQPISESAYRFRRSNFFMGQAMRFGGWDHDSLHLFQKGKARYEGRVHEKLVVEGTIGKLRVGVQHYPFKTFEQFLDRQNRYTTLQAQQFLETHPPLSMKEIWRKTTLRPVKIFWKIWFKKQGFRLGMLGFLFAGLFALVEVMLWSKVWELQHEKV